MHTSRETPQASRGATILTPAQERFAANHCPVTIDRSSYQTSTDCPNQIKWFKLSLETDNDVLSLPEGLTAIDVATDYFTALYKHIMTTLYRRFDANAMQRTRVDFVLTVPAIWSDGAKKKTEDAAIRAGMGNEHGLELLSEPESAAIYTLKNIDSTNSQVSVGDRIVVCDAGGGTVDLISYEVRQIHPQLSVAECTAGTGLPPLTISSLV